MMQVFCHKCGKSLSMEEQAPDSTGLCRSCAQAAGRSAAGAKIDWRDAYGFFLLVIGRQDSGPLGIARRIYDMAVAWGQTGNLPSPSAIITAQAAGGGQTVLFVTDSPRRAQDVMDEGLLRALESVAAVRLQLAEPATIRDWDRQANKSVLEPRFFPPEAFAAAGVGESVVEASFAKTDARSFPERRRAAGQNRSRRG